MHRANKMLENILVVKGPAPAVPVQAHYWSTLSSSLNPLRSRARRAQKFSVHSTLTSIADLALDK